MIDLHCHSTASDGSVSPEELVSLAQDRGITWLALTDHNTTGGLAAFLSAAKGTAIRAVAGVEVSCELAGQELHILALDLPYASFGPLEQAMSQALAWAVESKRELTEDLARAGYPVCYEALAARHPIPNRAHIALALKEMGAVASVQEAFDTLLHEDRGFYHPPRRLKAPEVTSMIRDLGAIPVWAHPFLKHGQQEVPGILEQLVPKGLEAMEVFYSTYSPGQTAAAQALAEAFRIKPSGGSDFHGTIKPDIALGTGRGDLRIPESVAETLFYR